MLLPRNFYAHLRLANAAFLAIFLTTGLAQAQSFYGGIRGQVKDGQGASIVNAKVTITDDATQVSRATVTNSDGEYVFSSVEPATYTIVCENPGFKKFTRKVIIGTQQFVTLDLPLMVGDVSESVMVTEEVPLMETSNASVGTLIDRQKLVDLPNIGRNPFIMAWVTPNVVPASDPRFVRFQDQSGSSFASFGGGPLRGNVYLLDGIPITDGVNRAVIIPSIESVQEMKIQLNTYDAELGRYAGGVYNTVLKSGGNQIHGSLFGNIRDTSMFANDFFANRQGLPKADSPYKLFGWSVGGPVRIPKVYDGRNKTFFWLVFEGYRQKTGQFTTLNEPTAAEKSGNFSASRNSDGTIRTIFDPLSTVRNADGSYTRTPFAGNIIPGGRISPVSAAIAAYFKAPTNANAIYGAPNYAASANLTDRANEATGKIDHTIREWWRVNLAYLHYGSKEPGPDWYGSAAAPGAWLLGRYADVTSVNTVITPTPTTVVNVRYGYNRFPNDSTMVGRGFDITKLGFSSQFASQIQQSQFPAINFTELTGMGCGGCGSFAVPNSQSFLTSFSKFAGGHSYKAGFQYRKINWDNTSYAGPGSFSFNNGFTRRDPLAPDTKSGADMASFLLGYPASGGTTLNSKFLGTFKYYGMFFHDDWRINSKLTLNMGVRYEYEQGYSDAGNRLIVDFDQRVTNPVQALLPAGSGVAAMGGLIYAGVNGGKTAYGNPGPNHFAPRIGAAYAYNSKTTFRGGYGWFWAPPVYGSQGAPGFSRDTPYIASVDGGITPTGNLQNPYPNGLLPVVGNSLGLLTGVGTSVSFWNSNMRSGGLVQQYSFDVQRSLPGNTNLTLGYVGSVSRHLQQNTAGININQVNPALFSQGNALLDLVANPFAGLAGSPGFFSSQRINRAQLLKPFPAFDAVTMAGHPYGRARYDAFVIKIERRFTSGLSLLSHYTYSKNRDNMFAGTNFSSSSGFSVVNNYDYENREYSLAANNTPSRFVAVTTYELPVGKGKKFLNSNKAVDYALGGWQFNAIATYQAGFPMSVGVSDNLNGFLGAGQRPNATGIDPKMPGSIKDKIDGFLNPKAFTAPGRFDFGNVGRTIPVRGPHQANWDVSLFKAVKIRERVDLQFRAEALNFTNTARFNPPSNTCVGCGSFGAITQQANFPRFIQLGGRVQF